MARLARLVIITLLASGLMFWIGGTFSFQIEPLAFVFGLVAASLTGFFLSSIQWFTITKSYKPGKFPLDENKSMKKSARVFLNYSREDSLAVKDLFRKLTAEGHEPWMDTENIVGGEEWKESIRRGIRECDLFLACLSSRSVDKRGTIQWEIRYALERRDEMLDLDIFVIPVRLEDCAVPEKLRHIEWIDLFEQGGWCRLSTAIQEALKRRKA